MWNVFWGLSHRTNSIPDNTQTRVELVRVSSKFFCRKEKKSFNVHFIPKYIEKIKTNGYYLLVKSVCGFGVKLARPVSSLFNLTVKPTRPIFGLLHLAIYFSVVDWGNCCGLSNCLKWKWIWNDTNGNEYEMMIQMEINTTTK